MNIQKTVNGTTLTVAVEGRLDTTTSPKLEEELKGSVDGLFGYFDDRIISLWRGDSLCYTYNLGWQPCAPP